MENKKGISLIKLVVTIIVIIVLSGAVILNLTKNNPIEVANKSAFDSSVDGFRSELLNYKSAAYTNTLGEFDSTKFQANETGITYTGPGNLDIANKTIYDVITTLENSKYKGQFEVKDGELVYVGTDEKLKLWAAEINLKVVSKKTIEDYEDGIANTVYKYTGDWIITSNNPYEGEYCFTNKDINDSDSSETSFVVNAPDDGREYSLGFYYFTSSENNYDFFRVYINDILVLSESGIVSDYAYNESKLNSGDNTIRFAYSKDSSDSSGLDSVFVDNIKLIKAGMGNPVITPSTTDLTNQNVNVTIAFPTAANLKQYSLDGSNWINYTNPIVITNNTVVYAKASSSEGETSESTLTISNIDKTNPQSATISNVAASDGTFTATVTLVDNQSGINLTNSKYIITTTLTTYATDNTVWNTATSFTSNSQNISALLPTSGDYCIQVLSSDNAGNKVVTMSESVNIEIYNATYGVNAPILTSGMSAVKWNTTTSTWDTVTDPATDTSWYDYANKKWANAMTADGSMWVWIPRYEYRILTPHTNTAQTIAVNFITNLQVNPTSGYSVHSGFTFGSTELAGIWVAKFEASGTINSIASKPDAVPLVSITISEMFTACRNMETANGTQYGWGTSGSNIDTHLIKNIEWGAVTYLSSSTYGKTGEVWINPYGTSAFGTSLTGRAGSSSNSSCTTTTYAYNNTTYGINTSTTGNVYGIYDMRGCSTEYTAAYVDNNNENLVTYGSSLYYADSKYKDVYATGEMTTGENYSLASTKKGDAIYETSASGVNYTAWYSDVSMMPYFSSPFFGRSGNSAGATSAGLFSFNSYRGIGTTYISFRPCLINI